VRVTKCEKILPSGAGADLGTCSEVGGVDRPRFIAVPRILLEGAPGAHVCPPVLSTYSLPVLLAGQAWQVCFDDALSTQKGGLRAAAVYPDLRIGSGSGNVSRLDD
jgi:hypothetical protein